MYQDFGERIFENYELFIKEHKSDLNSPADALEMLSSDGAFRAYIDSLTEGLDFDVKNNIIKIAERQREMMLMEESMNIGPTASVVGYAVSYFPILTDIYSDPVISRIATVFPTDKPVLTIPKVDIESSVKNTDGTTSKFSLPSNNEIVRAKPETITLVPGKHNSVHALSAGGLVNVDNAFLNKRYFIINKITYVDTAGVVHTENVTVRPDARGQINHSFDFTTDPSGDNFSFTIIGNVAWDTGVVQYNSTITNTTNPAAALHPSMQVSSIDASVMFSARRGEVGRVKVAIKTSGWDINIDVHDSFEIQLDQEVIQDYSDIYNIDMLKTLSFAIKNQMLYNKEGDLAYYLQSYEPEFVKYGSHSVYDMDQYKALGGTGQFTPANIIDIFKGVVPHITKINRNIHRLYRTTPQYLLAGSNTASLLESLQAYMVGFKSHSEAEVGFSSQNSVIDFRKQQVLTSSFIPDNKIYFVYKAPNDDLSRTAIVDMVYKPMYLVEEIDESQRKTYIKSRSALEITAPQSIGYIEMINHAPYI